METLPEQVDYIMCAFDFGRVKKTMDCLNWQWASCEGVPSLYEIKKKAMSLMKSLIKSGEYAVSTGGFRVTNDEGYLTLEFIVEEIVYD